MKKVQHSNLCGEKNDNFSFEDRRRRVECGFSSEVIGLEV